MSRRPAISVVVPFAGSRVEADRMLGSLARLELRDGDEVIVADNTKGGTVAVTGAARRRVVGASAERSSYHARNADAGVARKPWLLFIDADCAPSPGLLDAYFSGSVGESCGAVAGQIHGAAHQPSLAARYARSRRLFDHADGLIRASDGHAGAGNLLVRRAAFDAVGGLRRGNPLGLGRRPVPAAPRRRMAARIPPGGARPPPHRETLRSLLRAVARYGAGARWLERRYPGTSPRWPLAAGLAGVARDLLPLAQRGLLEAAAFRALDGLGLVAHNAGYLAGARANAVRR